MPPLWQYSSRLVNAKIEDESIAAPKRAPTPDPHGIFTCKSADFRGPPDGAMIVILDPLASRRRIVGEGHAPVVGVRVA